MFSVRKQSKARLAVLSLALLSATALSPVASAWAVDGSATPAAPASNPTPINATAQGQMMNMQMAAMQNAAQNTPMDSSFDGNVPKSTSLSANFGWMDTFDNSFLNGGYGGGVTATHWITPHFGLTASIEIESFGFGGGQKHKLLMVSKPEHRSSPSLWVESTTSPPESPGSTPSFSLMRDLRSASTDNPCPFMPIWVRAL